VAAEMTAVSDPRGQSVRAETLKSDAKLPTYEAPYGRASVNRVWPFSKILKRAATATISRFRPSRFSRGIHTRNCRSRSAV